MNFLTDHRNDGADEVKAARKIPSAALVDDARRRSVSVSVQQFVQPFNRERTTSQMMPSKRVVNAPKLCGLSGRTEVKRREKY